MGSNDFGELTRRDMDSLRTLTLCGIPFNASGSTPDEAEFDLTLSRLHALDGYKMYVKGLRLKVAFNLVDRPSYGPDVYIDPVIDSLAADTPAFPAAWGVSLSWLLARSRHILSGRPALYAFAEGLSKVRTPYPYLRDFLASREVSELLPWPWKFRAVEALATSEESEESLRRIQSAWETLVEIDMQLNSTVLYNIASPSSFYCLRFTDHQESVAIRESLLNAVTDRLRERQAVDERAECHRSWTAALRDTRLAHVKSRDLAGLFGASASRVRAYRSGDGASNTKEES